MAVPQRCLQIAAGAALFFGACASPGSTPDGVTAGPTLAPIATARVIDNGPTVEEVPVNDEEAASELAAAVDRMATVDHYRFELFASGESATNGLVVIDDQRPIGTGTQAGQTGIIELDFSAAQPFGLDANGSQASGDLTWTMITTPDALYLQAPFIATLAKDQPDLPDDSFIKVLGETATRWGRADLDRLGGVSGDDISAAIGQPGTPTGSNDSTFYSVLELDANTRRSGQTQLRGVEVHRFVASTTLAEALAQDPSIATDLALPPTALQQAGSASLITETFVGTDGYIRRIATTIDASRSLGFTTTTTLDVFDLNHQDTIEIPETDFDVTDELGMLLAPSEG